jgi:hypothetical protein
MNQSNKRREKYCAEKLFHFLTEAGHLCDYSDATDPPDFVLPLILRVGLLSILD